MEKRKSKIKIAVLTPAEIAIRRFLPALSLSEEFEFSGIGVYSQTERFGVKESFSNIVSSKIQTCMKKAESVIQQYGGRIFNSFQEVIEATDIDAVYIPLPPALHAKWSDLALKNGKHVLVEKPATTSYKDSYALVEQAKRNGLVFYENYMFLYHNQLKTIKEIIRNGKLGEIRLYKCSFEFPRRTVNDFRYDPNLGGGALLDAGGYTIRLATELLGFKSHIEYAALNKVDNFNVDMYGTGVLRNSNGQTAMISFGMDNAYQCSLEVFGSKGILRTGRIFTAPDGFEPTITIECDGKLESIKLPGDNSFLKSIDYFAHLINTKDCYKKYCESVLKQAQLVDDFSKIANKQ